jgi:fructuronate reductase
MVDRITPEPTDEVMAAVLAATGVQDRSPVITEPFSEWVVSGDFPGGRPAWQDAGAVFVPDVEPFEQRKLWLLNGAHSLLAYTGTARGHSTVAEAVADPVCRDLLTDWWNTCQDHLALPAADLERYRNALVQRFANPRMRHLLAQIGADGSQKLPVRILPVLSTERTRGQLPVAAVAVLAAWIVHLRSADGAVKDVRAGELQPVAQGSLDTAVPRVLAALGPDLAEDTDLVTAVRAAAVDLAP